jgi:YihY family inner membrane protein
MRRGAVEVMDKFLADRGTHLAAMIAYFALLAFVPLLFIALSLLSFGGEQNESSYLVKELRRSFPEQSVDELVDVAQELQENAGTLGVIGAVALVWASLALDRIGLPPSSRWVIPLTWALAAAIAWGIGWIDQRSETA